MSSYLHITNGDTTTEILKNLKIEGEIILDACCGVGQSTRILAKQNPQALVIGVDKSDHRINRNVEGFDADDGFTAENYHLVRADLNDFYRFGRTNRFRSVHDIFFKNF